MQPSKSIVAPLKRRSLSETIAQELEALILAGALKPGEKLPSEHSLAEQFGVSRNVVREGLRRLSEQGLVAIRAGDGVYAQTPNQETVIDAFSRYAQLNQGEHWVDDLYEARRVVECQVASLAAQRASDDDIRELEQKIENMRANTGDPHAWAQADLEFHASLALATHNVLFPLMLRSLHAMVLQAFEKAWHYPHAYEQGLRYHGELLTKIRARDAEGACETMRQHLEISRNEVIAVE
ncbi:MAG: FadR/GntR family transcriptional regulator [Anaerolineae bacterium]